MEIPKEDIEFVRAMAPEVVFTPKSKGVFIGAAGHEKEVFLEWYRDKWMASTKEWHGHFNDLREALTTAVQILSGEARTVSEYRDDVLASSWLEVYEEGSYYMTHMSMFMSPLDSEEWVKDSGEVWTTRRKVRRFVAAANSAIPLDADGEVAPFGEILETVRKEEKAAIHRMESRPYEWISEYFGEPKEGMRWTTDKNNMFVFQAPRRWKLLRPLPEKDVAFVPVHGEFCLRVATFFRDAPEPVEEESKEPAQPSSIEYSFEAICSYSPEWELHRWILQFSSGTEEMKARVELYRQLGGHDAAPYRDLLDETLPLSRFRFASSEE